MTNNVLAKPAIKDLIVMKVGPLQPSKFDNPFHLVILKGVDDGRSYKLNVQKRADAAPHFTNYNNWMRNLKEGSVLTCQMQTRKGNEHIVDQHKEFKIVKEAAKKAKEQVKKDEPNQESPEQLVLGIELDNIQRSINKIRQEFGIKI